MNRKPDFFIVGAPKCGTTAMAKYLGQHPDIFEARKEMHFFGRDLPFGAQFYRRNETEYLAEFDQWKGQRRAGEGSVWYLFSKTAAEEIKAFNPDARIIVMLREPVEMLYSLYNAFCWDGNECLPTFEEAIAAESERKAGRNIPRQTYFAPGLIYHEVARFEQQVRRYFDTFDRERVHIIVYDDMAADVARVYRRALDFLEVDSTKFPESFNAINRNKSVKNQTVRAIFADPLVRSTVLAIRPFVPRALFNSMQKFDERVRKFNSRAVIRPPLDPEFRARLKLDFALEVEKLSELLGRDLTHWTHDYPHHRATTTVTGHVAAQPPASAKSVDNLAA